jgi:hypothetical protein
VKPRLVLAAEKRLRAKQEGIEEKREEPSELLRQVTAGILEEMKHIAEDKKE